MKRSLILVCLLLALNATGAFANVSSYVNPLRMTAPQSVVRMHPVYGVEGCNVDVTTSLSDVYFVGQARRECVEKNKHNARCQQRCFTQVKLMVQGSAGRTVLGAYTRYGCQDVDPLVFEGTSANRCYYAASTECAQANPEHNFCRRKCVQKSHVACKRQLANAGYK